MNCYNFKNIISDYLDNNLPHLMRIEADEHLENCENCRIKLAEMKNILNSLHNLPKLKTSEDFNDKLLKKIEKHKSQKQFIFKQFLYKYSQPLSSAVAVFILLFGVYFVYNSIFPNMPNQTISTAEIQNNILNNPTNLSQPTANPQYVKNENDEIDSSKLNDIQKNSFENKIKMVNQTK